MLKCSSLVAIILSIPFALFSQEFRGTVTGSVTDATGALIAGAKGIHMSGASGQWQCSIVLGIAASKIRVAEMLVDGGLVVERDALRRALKPLIGGISHCLS